MRDSIDQILEDADEVFCFKQDDRPQERAHRYLEKYQVAREVSDTAMQRVARHLVERTKALYEDAYDVALDMEDALNGTAVLIGTFIDAMDRIGGEDVDQ